MRLTEHERERLLITPAADVAERRRGPRPEAEAPETVAILTSFVLEGARDGRTVAADPGALIVCRDSLAGGTPARRRLTLVVSSADTDCSTQRTESLRDTGQRANGALW